MVRGFWGLGLEEEEERSCRSCQKSQLWTRGGARFFWRRACRKLRISAPRAGGEGRVWGPEGEFGLSWEDMFALSWWCGARSGSFCVFRWDTGLVMYWCRDEKKVGRSV